MGLIIANILDLCDNLLYLLSNRLDTKKAMMKLQCVCTLFSTVSRSILQSNVGVLTSITCLVRNLLIYFNLYNYFNMSVIIAIQIVLGYFFNNNGVFGFIAILATILYSFMLLKSNDKNSMCVSIIINSILWSIYNFSICAFVAFAFNILSVIFATNNFFKSKVKNKE